ncbi:response regulator [Xylophilus sp. ASV27]|uniref:response regulator n=1 Tax=Xylophilus sp. ASV27 TaxID=2795129 RepID=UPI0018EB6F1A|nr:response regulator [Xylophilus sp. ASV27]
MTLKIYLIEDDEEARDAMAALLRQSLPVEIVGFGDNERSVTHWLSSHDRGWDLAIVDLQLRQGSGFAALQWCATRLPQQKVVVLSNLVSEEVRARCLSLGADAVFDKASEFDALVDYCRGLV